MFKDFNKSVALVWESCLLIVDVSFVTTKHLFDICHYLLQRVSTEYSLTQVFTMSVKK